MWGGCAGVVVETRCKAVGGGTAAPAEGFFWVGRVVRKGLEVAELRAPEPIKVLPEEGID